MGKKRQKKFFEFKKNRDREEAVSGRKVKGKISVSQRGLGFVTPEEGGPDIFIPPRYIGHAMHGDTVEVAVFKDAPSWDSSKGPSGKVTAIITRDRDFVIGELVAGFKVKPLSKNMPNEIDISGPPKGAKKGDWVKLRLLPSGSKYTEKVRGSVEETIGKAGTVEGDIKAVIKEFSIPRRYTEEEDNEASKIKPVEADRKDFSRRFCVTIDPVDAKDFDDAISISQGKKATELELGVHIADVAAWIRPGSKWDKMARERSFTSYLPGMTMPMLPRTLTRLISLTADKKSPAHSVIFTINKKTGKIISFYRTRSYIKVTARLNFKEVQEYIDSGKAPESWDKKFLKNIDLIIETARKLRKNRRKDEVFLDLRTVETRVLCDEATKTIKGLEVKMQKEADQVVEDCMLAANTAVAMELDQKKIPGVFRVHPEPNPDKIAEFSDFVLSAFGISTGDLTNRVCCNEFLTELPEDHKRPVITSAFLRSLPKAFYQAEPALHFGLGKMFYSHFTSPIRRYPDLLVHQQLYEYDRKGKLRSKKFMQSAAEECSEKEINNDEAYYSANDRLKLHYLHQINEDGPAPMYEAVVARITSAGLMADIPSLGIYGFVPSSYLGSPEGFTYKKGKGKIKARRDSREYKCGDFIFLKLDRIDLARAQAVFRPIID